MSNEDKDQSPIEKQFSIVLEARDDRGMIAETRRAYGVTEAHMREFMKLPEKPEFARPASETPKVVKKTNP